MEQLWVNAGKELPEEDMTVLVYLEAGFIRLGNYVSGRWYVIAAPWDDSACVDSEVLYWRELPAPPNVLPARKVTDTISPTQAKV